MTTSALLSAGRFDLLSAVGQDDAMVSIWSETAAIRSWLDVEGALAAVQGQVGVIDARSAELIVRACEDLTVDRERLWEETRTVGYPILPLLNQLTDRLPPEAAGRLHYGATTQDIMDTGLALQLVGTLDRVVDLLIRFGDGLAVLTRDHATTIMAGRTHAQQAVPITFGVKIAVFLEQVRTELVHIRTIREEIRVVSLFGAAGTSAAGGPHSAEVRTALAARLGLRDVTVPWHVARGGIARLGLALATIAAVCTRFAREVVDLSRTESGEVRERGGHHRGASSTMPQKANPISSEAIIGYGANAMAMSSAFLRGMEAGHERSAGEWQVEWVAIPATAVWTASALGLAAETAENLDVFADQMRANLRTDHGLVMSEAFMMRLAPLIGRDRAHKLVYDAAVRSREDGIPLRDQIRSALPAELRDGVVDLDAAEYLGETSAICADALVKWEQTRNERD